MQKQLFWKLFLVFIVVFGIGSLWGVPFVSLHYFGRDMQTLDLDYGLDLQGGAEILYRVKIEETEPGVTRVVPTAMEVIERRINASGVGEFRIEQTGNNILLQIPNKGEREIEEIKDIIKTTGKLTFHLVASKAMMDRHTEDKTAPPGHVWRELTHRAKEEGQEDTKEPILIQKRSSFTGDNIQKVEIVPDADVPIYNAVRLTLTSASRAKFHKLTKDHTNERLAIVLDGAEKGTVYSAPVIRGAIPRNPTISGNFTTEEAEGLAKVLLSGRLPAPIVVEYENMVGPSLGQDSIRDGTRAIIIGMAAVVVFMAFYYLVAGVIANLAVVFNLFILLGILAYLNATLTLPGLAGIVLLVGMSVDANVLIFERIKEEIAGGKPLSLALRNGYQRVFVTILDANLTTLFTAVILFCMGTGPVRGFAVTLGIGLAASMFTALFATRIIFECLIQWKLMSSFKSFSLIRNTSFVFSKYWKVAAIISAVSIVVGLTTYKQRGREMYDIDFLGGALIHVRFAEAREIDAIREEIAGLSKNFEGCQVQSVWSPHQTIASLTRSKEFEIRIELPEDEAEHDEFVRNMKAKLREGFAGSLAREAIGYTLDEPVTHADGLSTANLTMDEPIDIAALEKQLGGILPEARVTGRGNDEGSDSCREIRVTTTVPSPTRVASLLKTELSSGPFPRTRNVSAQMARLMIGNAIKAMVWAMIGIIVYMAFRFQLRFGIGAVVALIHDVLITMGALAAVGVEVNLPIIAAFLTIVGYSLNDTIVVFDRIRENMKTAKNRSFIEIVDLSVNQTLGRTLLTSVTTLFAAGALFIWGGGVIHDFAYALIVGIVAGTYSSIFVATPVAALLEPAKE